MSETKNSLEHKAKFLSRYRHYFVLKQHKDNMEIISPIQPHHANPQSLGISPETWTKLEAVKSKVNNIIDRVERLHNQVDLFNVSELQSDAQGKKKVENIQKYAAYYSEELLKQLMTLGK